MTVVLLVFLGGVLTILSPCILPVLPFVFARSEQRFLTNGLPLLAGMAATFAGIATLAAVGGAWAVRVNQYGRVAALVLLSVFAATLLSRRLADGLSRPFVAVGNRLLRSASDGSANLGPLHAALLGAATGLLWAPCAGPILGLVLTGASHFGAERPHHVAAVLLCRRCSDIFGGCDPRRRPSIRDPEEIAGCGRMGEAGAGRRHIAGSDCHCLRLGQQHPHALVTGRHQSVWNNR